MYNNKQDVGKRFQNGVHFTKYGEAFRMKKWLSMFLLMVLLVGLLVACGPDNAKPENNGNDNNNTEETNGKNNGNKSEGAAEVDIPEKTKELTHWENAEEKEEDTATHNADT